MHKYTIDVFKDMYYHELNAKEALNSRISVPLTALSIVATLIIYFAGISDKLPALSSTSVLLCAYYLITIVIVILVIYAAILLLLLVYGSKYAQSPSPKVIEDYVKEVEQYYASYPEDEKEIRTEYDVKSYLNDLYRDATDKNSANNIEKNNCMRKANICIIVALVLCIVNAVPLFMLIRIYP